MKFCKITLDNNGKKKINFGKKWGDMTKETANASFIETGNGLFVIDADFKKVKKAPKKIKRFIKALGKPTVETARGFHWYIKSTAPIENYQNIFKDKKWGVDIRGKGGIVFTDYWGKEKNISYVKTGKPIKDKNFKIFKLLPKHIREPKKRKKTIKRGDVGKESQKDVKAALNRVNILDYQDRDQWMKILAAVYHGLGKKGEKLARKWSKGDKKNYDKGAFDNIWSQLTTGKYGSDISVGTLYDASRVKKIEPTSAFKPEKGSVVVKDKKIKKKEIKEKAKAIKELESKIEYNQNDFPKIISKYMKNVADQHGLNFSATVPYVMIALSQAIGSKIKVKMNRGWTHTPIIWGLNVASAGIGKSPMTKKLSAPIWDIQNSNKKRHDLEMKKYHKNHRLWVQAAKKGEMGEESEPEKPIMKMLQMDEFTPEALYDQLDDNPNGLIVWKDELKGMFQKSEKNEILRSKLISAWSGQSITRNTKTQGMNILKEPYVRVGGNVQSEVVKQILNDNKSGMNADGFIVRFQLIAHLKKLGFVWNVDVDEFARESYNRTVKKIYKDKTKKILTFDNKGEKMVEEFMRNVDIMLEDAIDNFEKEYISKIGSLFGSMIAILHQLTSKKKDTVVSTKTIRKASKITMTAYYNAMHLFSIEKREKAKFDEVNIIIEKWLKNKGKAYFKKHKNEVAPKLIKNSLAKKVTTKDVVDFFENKKGYLVIPRTRGHYIRST